MGDDSDTPHLPPEPTSSQRSLTNTHGSSLLPCHSSARMTTHTLWRCRTQQRRSAQLASASTVRSSPAISLRRSSAVIADLSESKPNVLYEAGLAHALKRPSVHICSTPIADLPFDVRNWNTIFCRRGQTTERLRRQAGLAAASSRSLVGLDQDRMVHALALAANMAVERSSYASSAAIVDCASSNSANLPAVTALLK